MSMMALQTLRAMVFEKGHIKVVGAPEHEYREFIAVCGANGLAISSITLSRDMLDNLVKSNFVKQDGPESESHITIFKLTDKGRDAAEPTPRTSKKLRA
jgi:hypothetical protein